MFERALLNNINSRLSAGEYHPVKIRGARGCGKTTLAGQFAQRFAQTMLFDLSKPYDRQVFEKIPPDALHFHDLFLVRNRDPNAGRTLLFIDNVHDAPEIWDTLVHLPNRPWNLFLLGASDVAVRSPQSPVPSPQFAVGSPQSAVGGVQPSNIEHPTSNICLKPLSFSEFLAQAGELESHKFYNETPCPDHAHEKLLSLFHRYVTVGGMPEAVAAWTGERSMARVEKAFDHILAGWDKLLHEQARSRKSAALASSLLNDSFPFAAERISFHNFANRQVRSREASDAFRTLGSLMFLSLVHPVTGHIPGEPPDTGRSPRLQFADTGMVIYLSGIRHPVSSATDLTQLVGGQVLRHVVGQELGTRDEGRGTKDEGPFRFWVRGNPQSKAEVDFVIHYEDMMIPVVAKSGEPGRLRSLHSFLDAAPHPFAVRLCADRLNVRKAETLSGKPYYLLSLPYYLAGRINEHLDGFVRYVR